MDPIIVVGSGLAGYTFAREWRKLDKTSPLVLITADDGRAYSKPMLSSALSAGKQPQALATADAAQMAQQLAAQVRAETRVTGIDRQARTVQLDGETLRYRYLVLAVGAQQRKPALEGGGASRVHTVNDLAQYSEFRRALGERSTVALIGAGLIGCEFANDLLAGGHAVHVVAWADVPLERLVPWEIGAALRDALAAKGVIWHGATSASRVDRQGMGLRVTLANGAAIDADVVLSATGLIANTELARACGLTVNRGIVVNRGLRSSDPDIYALGDCIEMEGLVLPYVMPLMNQARALAHSLSGTPTSVVYPVMPVAVKTPAYPICVAPPRPDVPGEWDVQTQGLGIKALFRTRDGQIAGFALGGAATAEKNALAKEIAPLLPPA